MPQTQVFRQAGGTVSSGNTGMGSFSVSSGTNPFGTAEFLQVWWEHNRRKVRPLSGFSGRGYLLKAFCTRRIWNVVRSVEACGAGVADYTELDWRAVSPAQYREFLEAFLKGRKADIVILPRVNEEYLVGKLTAAFAEEFDLPFFRLHYDSAPYVLLDTDWEAYYLRKGRKFRYNLRRAERKLDEMGGLEFLHVSTPRDVEQYMDWAFQLYARRAEESYRGSLWLIPSGQKLLTQLALRFSECGWLDLTFLLVGGQPVAFCLGFDNQVDYYFYATAFDPDPRYSQYSPGVLLIKHLLQKAFDSGLRRFDFMLGDEPYKKTWATHCDDILTYVICTRRIRSRIAFFFYCRILRLRQTVRHAPKLRYLAEKALLALPR